MEKPIFPVTRRTFLNGTSALAGSLIVDRAVQAQESADSTDLDRPLLLAHYMPWYQTPTVTGYWGWH